MAAARPEQGSNPHPTRQKCKRPHKGAFRILAERVAKISLPRNTEEVQKFFSILHLANLAARVIRANPAKAGSQT